MLQKRLVSGIKPTGDAHLGNYLGAIKQWVELQHEYDCFFFIADYHALTTRPEPKTLKQRTLEIAAILIAFGIDPERSTLFVQSQIAAHTDLMWLMANFTSMGQLNRMVEFKEKSDKYGQNAGLFTYPVLMAADIALYGAQVVPVGEDQVQHLELAREIVRSVNNHTGKSTLVEPKPLLTKAARIMSLSDPAAKMSKTSPGGAIGILDSEAEIIKAIKRAVTDSDPNATEMSPGLRNLFTILEEVSHPDTIKHFQQLHAEGKLHYSELKEQLIDDVLGLLRPVQAACHKLSSNEVVLKKMLVHGQKKAEVIASESIARIKKDFGLL